MYKRQLFYRAIQSTGDLFRDATDFKFSFVAYNRRGEPYRPDRMSLNGIRLPSRYIQMCIRDRRSTGQ